MGNSIYKTSSFIRNRLNLKPKSVDLERPQERSSKSYSKFSNRLVKLSSPLEKRKFERETPDAKLELNGEYYDIDDISISGLRLKEKIKLSKGYICDGVIFGTVDDITYGQKARFCAVSEHEELSTRFEIVLLIDSPYSLHSETSQDTV